MWSAPSNSRNAIAIPNLDFDDFKKLKSETRTTLDICKSPGQRRGIRHLPSKIIRFSLIIPHTYLPIARLKVFASWILCWSVWLSPSCQCFLGPILQCTWQLQEVYVRHLPTCKGWLDFWWRDAAQKHLKSHRKLRTMFVHVEGGYALFGFLGQKAQTWLFVFFVFGLAFFLPGSGQAKTWNQAFLQRN